MTVHELAAEFGCSVRTVYRDINHVQEHMDAPLVCDRDEGDGGEGRWRLLDGWKSSSQPAEFDPSELLSLMAATRLLEPLKDTAYGEGLETLRKKVRDRLPAAAVRFVEADGATLSATLGSHFDARRHASTIEVLRRSIRERRTVEMRYRSLHSGKETLRRLDPYRLWFSEGVLYVVGGCHVHGKQPRTFAVDRVRNAVTLRDRFEIPQDFRWDDYVGRSFRVFHGEPRRVTIEFGPSLAPVMRERRWHASQTTEEAADGSVRVTLEVAGLFEVAHWILGFGAEARAIAPAELVETVRRELDRARARYGSGAGKGAKSGAVPPPGSPAPARGDGRVRGEARPAAPRGRAPRRPPPARAPRRSRSRRSPRRRSRG